MKTQDNTKAIRQWKRAGKPEEVVPFAMTLADGRVLFVEVPKHMTSRDRSGELVFTLAGVKLLDRVQVLAMKPGPAPSPAYLLTLREALGLTQSELGRLIGRDKLTISRWERGTVRPGPEALEKLYELARKMKRKGVLLAG